MANKKKKEKEKSKRRREARTLKEASLSQPSSRGKEKKQHGTKLKEEHLRRMHSRTATLPPGLLAMIGALEWVLGDKKSLPDIV